MKDYSFRYEGSKKKGVLLVHGLTGSPPEMRFVGKKLNKMGFTVYAPMLAGHCIDEAALVKTTYEDWIEGLRAAIRTFSKEVDEVYMAGICVGGGLALYAAHLESGLVKGVAIYSAALNYDGWNVPFYYPVAGMMTPMLIKIPFLNRISFDEISPYGIKSDRIRKALMATPKGIEGTLPSFPAKSLYQNSRLNKKLKEILPMTKIPTLLVHATEDDVSHPRNSKKIQKLHGSVCKIEWLSDSYHLIHVDQERNKVAELTGHFFGLPEVSFDTKVV